MGDALIRRHPSLRQMPPRAAGVGSGRLSHDAPQEHRPQQKTLVSCTAESQAFRKLHIASRVQLARIVIEQAADALLLFLASGNCMPAEAGPGRAGSAVYPQRRHRPVATGAVRVGLSLLPRTAQVQSCRPIPREPDVSATRTPGIHAGPGAVRR